MQILSYGDIIPEGRYSVHSRFKRAVNFENGGVLVCIVEASIGCGPTNIVVDALDAAACPATLCVEKDRFVLGNQALRKEADRLFHSSMGLNTQDSTRFLGNLKVLGDFLRNEAPFKSLAFLLGEGQPFDLTSGYEREFCARMRQGLRHMREGCLADGARTFRGAGLGLTPSGDDFLSGFLIGLKAAEMVCGKDLATANKIVYQNAIGGSLIVNAGLTCARDGRVFEQLKGLVHALARSGNEDVRISARRLFEVGETSGADMATGFYVSVALFTARLAAATQKVASNQPSEVVDCGFK